MRARTPIVMIGLDAADARLVEDLIEQGKLPELAALRARGCSGTLRSPAMSYAGAVWPSFYTGQDVPWHGIYHNKLWRPEAMRCEVPTDAWLASRPFWEQWNGRGLRTCVVDAPMVLGRPRETSGLYLGGWGTHDLISRGSWPRQLWRDLARKYGAPRMPSENFGLQSAASLGKLRSALLSSVDQMQQIACDLLSRERWDFFCFVFGAIHRAGHYLTDLSQLDESTLSAAQLAELQGALVEIYRATDGAIGRILERVGGDALVIAFAVHGMGPNPGWGDLVPDILGGMQKAASGRRVRSGALYSLKKRVPLHWVRPALNLLPPTISEGLVSFWSARMFDWHVTRYFPLPMDHAAYLRVNLRGREREGLVERSEYEASCAELATLFTGLRDGDSGHSLASEVLHAYAEAPESAPQRALLPDLVVPWIGPRASQTRALVCDAIPAWRYEVPTRLPSGRSGNHVGHGWFIAAGPGVAPKHRSEGYDILDLAPTVTHCMGLEPLPSFQGRIIDLSGNAAG